MFCAKRLCSTLLAVLVLSSVLLAAPDSQRSYVSGNFFVILDGVKCGYVKSIDGGGISAEVINEPAGPNTFVKKHIGQPKYEEFTLQVGFSMNKALYEWIAQSWNMKYQRKGGSVVALDYTLTPKSERQFTQALITETTIPAMDGSSKEPAYLTVKFAPEVIRYVAATGSKTDFGEYGKNEQKVWLPCNFKLEIAGLDCTRVNKVDSFTVKQAAVTNDVGNARDYAKEPGKLVFPNLKVTLAEETTDSWIAWHEDFVVKGNNDESREKSGMLTLLGPDRQKALLRIKFYNLGIFRLQPDKAEANADQVKRVTAEMYVERMEFLYGEDTGGTSAPATPPATIPAAPGGARRG
jgi:phage tail-like protein